VKESAASKAPPTPNGRGSLDDGGGLRFWQHERQNADLHQKRQQRRGSSRGFGNKVAFSPLQALSVILPRGLREYFRGLKIDFDATQLRRKYRD
jgi:hypothetical protein